MIRLKKIIAIDITEQIQQPSDIRKFSTEQKVDFLKKIFFSCSITNKILTECYVNEEKITLNEGKENQETIGYGDPISLETLKKYTGKETGLKNILANNIFNNLVDIINSLEKEIVPDEISCAISTSLLDDPLILKPFGTTYQKDSVESWAKSNNKREPLHGTPIKEGEVITWYTNTPVKYFVLFLKQAYPFLNNDKYQ